MDNSHHVVYYKSVANGGLYKDCNLRSVRMRGPSRVLLFCLLIAVLPAILLIIPLYLRHVVFADVLYSVAESDVVEIDDGISSIFCQEHSLHMNTTFQAFQVMGRPQLSEHRKHVQLSKSMKLLDDTLEYWGFYLLKGSTVELSLCSRFEGSRILVVEGERNLRSCGLMEHSEKPLSAHMANGHIQVSLKSKTENRSHNLTEDTLQMEEDEEENLKYLIKLSEHYIDRHPSTLNSTVVDKKASQTHRIPMEHTNGTKEPSMRKRRDVSKKSLLTSRKKRNLPAKEGHILDAKTGHGHAGNETDTEGKTGESSVSSFENNLLACYDGNILLVQSFPPSTSCTNHAYLLNDNVMKTTHEVEADGYYYYIFYSDNDIVENNIYTIFNIYKPTYNLANLSKECINQTECTFPISFWSDDTVIVEIPTTSNDIEGGKQDLTFLISSCHPRMSVYVVFPITVLFFILICAFL